MREGMDDPPLLQQIDRQLVANFNAQFSNEAKRALFSKVYSYTEKLITLSAVGAQHQRADTVSVSDVERAGDSLNPRSKSLFRKISGAFGGLLLGTGLSTIISMMLAKDFPNFIVLLSLAASITGSFMIAIDLAEDASKR